MTDGVFFAIRSKNNFWNFYLNLTLGFSIGTLIKALRVLFGTAVFVFAYVFFPFGLRF